MFTCPVCRTRSISCLHQFVFSHRTRCLKCSAVVRVKRKPTNYLVPLLLVASAASIAFFGTRIDLMNPTGFAVLVLLGIVQVMNLEYVQDKRR